MYDSSPWNDIPHLLEFKTFKVLGQQVGYLLGLREARYARDGYRRFVPPQNDYDLARAQKRICGTGVKKKETVTDQMAETGPPLVFGSHGDLKRLLQVFPDATRKILFFVPYHALRIPTPGSRAAHVWDGCRSHAVVLARTIPSTVVVNFMIPSEITRRDENY